MSAANLHAKMRHVTHYRTVDGAEHLQFLYTTHDTYSCMFIDVSGNRKTAHAKTMLKIRAQLTKHVALHYWQFSLQVRGRSRFRQRPHQKPDSARPGMCRGTSGSFLNPPKLWLVYLHVCDPLPLAVSCAGGHWRE